MRNDTRESRKGIMAVLVVSGFFVGLMVGGFLAGTFWVDKSEGLAGGVMVLFYALGVAVLIAVACGMAGKLLVRKKARTLAWAMALIGMTIMVLVAWRVVNEQIASNIVREAAYSKLLPYEIHVTGSPTSAIAQFSYVYTDDFVTANVNGQECSGNLKGTLRVALLSALRGLEGKTIECTDCNAKSTKVVWQIREALGNINGGEFRISENLLSKHASVRNMLDIVVQSAETVDCK